MKVRYAKKAQTAFGLLTSLCLTSGCKERPAEIRSGCYRLSNGKPLFTVQNERATFKVRGAIRGFALGSWQNEAVGDLMVRPGFYLHDGSPWTLDDSDYMPLVADGSPDGTLTYRLVNGTPTLEVPIEAYGHETLSLGRPC